ncbi:hypothetical protein SAMN04490244_101200 [Tranquillimonas rosea]|uniref:Uncharacterized protein n=1 Tax=Tranquillimonas rosea TaxID=641238 RepID=A0A1H9PIM0_9RHOB|nr:hypothetical protein [Tranquillimonas rosea]SER47994.1 hypothetical protein SAMN04490244_101200 [Tranquillimonas rosea]
MDRIAEIVADALGQSRLVRKCLDAKIIPILDPRHRSFAGDISRRISSRNIVNEAFLRDIETLIVRIGEEAESETSYAWRGHEHDPECGYAVPLRTERAGALQLVQDELVELATLVQAALDAAEACVIANALFDT